MCAFTRITGKSALISLLSAINQGVRSLFISDSL
jgi:hypothetical protein